MLEPSDTNKEQSDPLIGLDKAIEKIDRVLTMLEALAESIPKPSDFERPHLRERLLWPNQN